MIRASWVLRNSALSSASAAEAATSFRIAHVIAMFPLSLIGWSFLGTFLQERSIRPPNSCLCLQFGVMHLSVRSESYLITGNK